MQLAVVDLARSGRRGGVRGVVLAMLLLLASTPGFGRAAAQGAGTPTPPAASAPSPAQPAPTRWTLFVWMAADNDLEPQGIEDLKEMELGIPDQGVEIIVFVDRFTPNNKRFGDWSGGRLYRIRPNRDRESFASELLREFGPVDSSDPKLFAEQMAAAFKRFPAAHYGTVLWNHGGGWSSLAVDEHNPQAPNKKTSLTIMQVADALRGGIAQSGIGKLDLIGFDMCLMAQLETAAELRDLGRMLVASQAIEPGTGWAYDRFLPVLARPDTTLAELANAIVETFDGSNRAAREAISTLSAIDLERIEPVLKGFDDALAALLPHLGSLWTPVNQSLFWAEGYATGGRIDDLQGGEHALASVDLVDMFKRIQANALSAFPAAAEVQRLQAAVRAAVIGNLNSDRHRASNGIAVYAPVRAGSIAKTYAATRLAKESRWLPFLAMMHAEAQRGSKPPEVVRLALEDAVNGLEQTRSGLGANTVLRVVLRGQSVLFATGAVLRRDPQHPRLLIEQRGFLVDTEMAGERLASGAASEATDLLVPQYSANGAQLSTDMPGLGYVVAIGDRVSHATIDARSFVNGLPQPKVRAYVNAAGLGPVLSLVDFDPISLEATGITALIEDANGRVTPRGIKPRPELQIVFLVAAVSPNDRVDLVPGGPVMSWDKGPRLLVDLAPPGSYRFQVGAESIAGAGEQKQVEFEIGEPDPGLMMFVHAARARPAASYAGVWRLENGTPFGTLVADPADPDRLTLEYADAAARDALAKARQRSIVRIDRRRMPTLALLTLDDRGEAKAGQMGLLYADPANPERIRIRTLIGRKGDPRGQSLVLVRVPGTGPAMPAPVPAAVVAPPPQPGAIGAPIAVAPPVPAGPSTGYVDPSLPVGTWRGRTHAGLPLMMNFHANGSYQQQITYGPSFVLDIVGRWSISGAQLILQPQSWSPSTYCVGPGQCQAVQLAGETLGLEFRNDATQLLTPSFVVQRLR
ncbi:MAG: hypothetical protein JNK67_02085 [Alphaproteobacteria bacterium]|nr:hypothetical protein [Alphaproteobacteria bacterium]